MSNIVFHKVFEGEGYPSGKLIDTQLQDSMTCYFGNGANECWSVHKSGEYCRLHTSYYIGVDWILKDQEAIYVRPKRITENHQADALVMLSLVLSDNELSKYCSELYEIKDTQPSIAIAKEDDFLSPLILAHFVQLLKSIVKKGLLKGYRKVSRNLNGRVRGRINVGRTIRKNYSSGAYHRVHCTYSEFDADIPENRLLKAGLQYCIRAFSEFDLGIKNDDLQYILPAFKNVGECSEVERRVNMKPNPFYAEYKEALALAKLILQRFGYSLNNVDSSKEYKTPPFWIDMSKLFELYSLSLLRKRFGASVHYHYWVRRNELDYLLDSDAYKMVIDAKYKTIYQHSLNNDDMRQVAGYSRLSGVYQFLDVEYPTSVDALILYPELGGVDSLQDVDLKRSRIDSYEGMYKLGVQLPLIRV